MSSTRSSHIASHEWDPPLTSRSFIEEDKQAKLKARKNDKKGHQSNKNLQFYGQHKVSPDLI